MRLVQAVVWTSLRSVHGSYRYKLTDSILKQLEPIKEKIVEVCKSHNLSPRMGVVLTLSIDKDESSPDVGFGARMIRFLADLGAFINIDYQLSERI
jgi:hypothetical protein